MLAPYIAQVGNPEQLTLKFRFQVNGTSDPDFVLPGGCVTDVARSTVGVFAITLAEKYPVFVGCVGSVLGDDGVSLGAIVQSSVADYVAATGVLTVRVVDTYADATPAPVDPTDNDWVYVEVTVCRRSGLSAAKAI